MGSLSRLWFDRSSQRDCCALRTVLRGRSVSPKSVAPSLSLFRSSTFIFQTCWQISSYLLRLLSPYPKPSLLGFCTSPYSPNLKTRSFSWVFLSKSQYPCVPSMLLFPVHFQYHVLFLTHLLHLPLTLSFSFLVPFSFSLHQNFLRSGLIWPFFCLKTSENSLLTVNVSPDFLAQQKCGIWLGHSYLFASSANPVSPQCPPTPALPVSEWHRNACCSAGPLSHVCWIHLSTEDGLLLLGNFCSSFKAQLKYHLNSVPWSDISYPEQKVQPVHLCFRGTLWTCLWCH